MVSNIKLLLKFVTGKAFTGRELKKLIRFTGLRDQHHIYEYLIKRHDPSLDLSGYQNFTQKSFLNEGRGMGTLKPYRILENKNRKVFEKIFFNTSKNLRSALYFDEQQEDLLDNKDIRAPRILNMIKGDHLTILHFEYLDLDKLPVDKAYPVLKSKTLELCKDLPYNSSNSSNGGYSRGMKQIYNPRPEWFEEEFGVIETIARSFPVYFQHLDLGEENVYRDDMVIDWDNSGYYNMGVDFGRLLLAHYILSPSTFLSTYKNELKDYHRKSNSGVPFEDFEPVVMFYFLTLFYGHHDTEGSLDKIEPVIREFKATVRAYEVESAEYSEMR